MITAVIPTLGGESLDQTIISLNSGKLIPDEIIVCIPEEVVDRVKNINYDNVVILKIDKFGQVYQRSQGFKYAKHEYVLQIDDDILLEEESLYNLNQDLVRLGKGNVVAPVYYDCENANQSHHGQHKGIAKIISLFYGWSIAKAPFSIVDRMGSITSLGITYGVDSTYFDSSLIHTDWVSGGCILGYKDELVLDDFYPYSGKAYCEDILHSILRNKMGIKHHVISNSIAYTPFLLNRFKFSEFYSEVRIRFYIAKMIRGSAFRVGLWSTIELFKRIL